MISTTPDFGTINRDTPRDGPDAASRMSTVDNAFTNGWGVWDALTRSVKERSDYVEWKGEGVHRECP